jgi:hypothetical protein
MDILHKASEPKLPRGQSRGFRTATGHLPLDHKYVKRHDVFDRMGQASASYGVRFDNPSVARLVADTYGLPLHGGTLVGANDKSHARSMVTHYQEQGHKVRVEKL